MLPDFPANPFSLVMSEENRQFAQCLQDQGAEVAKVTEILRRFYSFEAVLGAISKNVKNPEWLDTVQWLREMDRQYKKAIRAWNDL